MTTHVSPIYNVQDLV